MTEHGQALTLSQVRHELAETETLLSSLRRGLDFLTETGTRKILYLIDYPEITAYWESQRPGSARQLSHDSVKRVWQYLTGLERVFVSFADTTDDRLHYIQRAYEEQAEYLDGLLLSSQFQTLIAPPCWKMLRADITHFSHFSDDPGGNWSNAIIANETDLRELISAKQSPRFSERLYVAAAERFGFASLARQSRSNVRDILLPFIHHANFCEPIDFPWFQNSNHIEDNDELRKILACFEPDLRSSYWLGRIDEGNDLYNEAYDQHGRWNRRNEGAEILAYLEFLNETINRYDPNLRIAFVTRNHQYHDCLRALSNSGNNSALPLIFHPRLLSAFMIRQAIPMQVDDRINFAKKASGTVEELSYQLRSVDELVSKFLKPGAVRVSAPLRHFVRRRLQDFWTDYRKQSLAEQIQIRIELRKDRWKIRSKDKIRQYLYDIVKHNLKTIQIGRELALLRGLPDLTGVYGDVKCIFIPLSDSEDGGVSLLYSDLFSHSFKFHSRSIREKLLLGKKRVIIDISNIAQKSRSEIEDKYNKYLSTNSKLRLKNEVELELLRFDVLLIFAILLTTKGELKSAQKLVDSARAVWKFADAKMREKGHHQLYEALYFESLIRAMEWRKTQHDQDAHAHLRSGLDFLKNLIKETKEFKLDRELQTKRLDVFIVAFTRELYAFAVLHKVTVDQKSWPHGINQCLELLDSAYKGAKETGFTYVAMRARQNYLAFARMANEGVLKAYKFDKRRFSKKQRLSAFQEFSTCLKELTSGQVVWQDALPFSVLITELAGLSEFRDELQIGRRTIESHLQRIEAQLDRSEGRNYRNWAVEIVDKVKRELEQKHS